MRQRQPTAKAACPGSAPFGLDVLAREGLGSDACASDLRHERGRAALCGFAQAIRGNFASR